MGTEVDDEPLVPDELLREVVLRYRLGEAEPECTLPGGEWNRVVRLRTPEGPRVLRIAHPRTARPTLEYSHAVMRYMADRILEVPAPLAQTDGSTILEWESWLAALFPLCEGQPAEEYTWLVAGKLAGLHRWLENYPASPHPVFRPLREMDWDTNHLWDWRRLAPFLKGDPASLSGCDIAAREELLQFAAALRSEGLDLRRETERFRDQIQSLANQPLTTGIIHGDFYEGNLLVAQRGLTAILDWDETRPEWLVYELGRATWEFCSDGNTLIPWIAGNFIHTYRGDWGPAPESEFPLVVFFARYTRLEDALFDLNGALQGDPWSEEQSEYHLENLRAMQRMEHEPPELDWTRLRFPE